MQQMTEKIQTLLKYCSEAWFWNNTIYVFQEYHSISPLSGG